MAAAPIPSMDFEDSFKDAMNSTSGAAGGTIRTGMIFNSSGAGSFGLVKTLAIAGVALLFFKIWRRK